MIIHEPPSHQIYELLDPPCQTGLVKKVPILVYVPITLGVVDPVTTSEFFTMLDEELELFEEPEELLDPIDDSDDELLELEPLDGELNEELLEETELIELLELCG